MYIFLYKRFSQTVLLFFFFSFLQLVTVEVNKQIIVQKLCWNSVEGEEWYMDDHYVLWSDQQACIGWEEVVAADNIGHWCRGIGIEIADNSCLPTRVANSQSSKQMNNYTK